MEVYEVHEASCRLQFAVRTMRLALSAPDSADCEDCLRECRDEFSESALEVLAAIDAFTRASVTAGTTTGRRLGSAHAESFVTVKRFLDGLTPVADPEVVSNLDNLQQAASQLDDGARRDYKRFRHTRLSIHPDYQFRDEPLKANMAEVRKWLKGKVIDLAGLQRLAVEMERERVFLDLTPADLAKMEVDFQRRCEHHGFEYSPRESTETGPGPANGEETAPAVAKSSAGPKKASRRGPKAVHTPKVDDKLLADYKSSGMKVREFCDAKAGLFYRDGKKNSVALAQARVRRRKRASAN